MVIGRSLSLALALATLVLASPARAAWTAGNYTMVVIISRSDAQRTNLSQTGGTPGWVMAYGNAGEDEYITVQYSRTFTANIGDPNLNVQPSAEFWGGSTGSNHWAQCGWTWNGTERTATTTGGGAWDNGVIPDSITINPPSTTLFYTDRAEVQVGAGSYASANTQGYLDPL